jgi:hypothetical protein
MDDLHGERCGQGMNVLRKVTQTMGLYHPCAIVKSVHPKKCADHNEIGEV